MVFVNPPLPSPDHTTLLALANLPYAVALSPRRLWLPLDRTCRVVNRITNEMAALVAERVLHRRDRRRTLWHLRQIAMYVCNVTLQIPIADIAVGFGRDRRTVAYALGIVEDRRDDRAYDEFVGAVERMVNSVFASEGGSGDD
ncbi:MAG: helix-turn-helix domain-containing protein [Rhizobium sp.]